MQIVLNIRSIGNKTAIRNIFSMWTLLPKWGRGKIWLTIVLLSNKTLMKNILIEMRWKIFCERQQQKPWFQQLVWLLFLSLTIDNSKKYTIDPTYYNEALDTEFQWMWLSIWGERGISLSIDIIDTSGISVNNHKINLWMPAFLIFFNSFLISNLRGADTAVDQRKNFH